MVKWSWDAPVDPTAQRNTVLGVDWNQITLPNIFSREGLVHAQKRLIYVDRHGPKVLLHLLDLEHRRVRQVELANEGNLGITPAYDDVTLMVSGGFTSILSGKFGLDAINEADASVLWHTALTVPPGNMPIIGIAEQTFWAYDGQLLIARSAKTLQPKWERGGLNLEFAQPQLAQTRSQGTVLIAKSISDRKIHAIRLSDGQDAWVSDLQTDKTYHIIADQSVIVFEPDKRMIAVDLETGKTLADLPVKQVARAQTRGSLSVTALTHEGTLYFSSDADELLAIDLGRDTPSDKRLRWKTPLKARVQGMHANGSHVYVGTETGELLILDSKSGNVLASAKVADKNLEIDHSSANIVVASSAEAIFGLHPISGAQIWEYPSGARAKKPVYVKGVVILQTSPTQISALDTETGKILW